MQIEEFIERYPRLLHMAEAGAWPYIQRHGLLSTKALLDLFEVQGEERFAIESMRRPQIVGIEHAIHGRATIRDNKPLKEQFLLDCLVGYSPQQWYELLNRKVFFWVTLERLESLLEAKAYRTRAHDVLTIDTRLLFDRQLGDITLAPFNTGATLYPSAPPRGPSTFQPVDEYDWEAMRRLRGARKAVAELTVDYAVPDVEAVATLVERRAPDEAPAILWRRP